MEKFLINIMFCLFKNIIICNYLKNSYKENKYIFDDNNRSSNIILKIKTLYGWHTIDSLNDPEEEAVKSLGNSFDSQTSIILIGAVAEQNYSILYDYESTDGNAYIILADVFDINLQKRFSEILEQRNSKMLVFSSA